MPCHVGTVCSSGAHDLLVGAQAVRCCKSGELQGAPTNEVLEGGGSSCYSHVRFGWPRRGRRSHPSVQRIGCAGQLARSSEALQVCAQIDARRILGPRHPSWQRAAVSGSSRRQLALMPDPASKAFAGNASPFDSRPPCAIHRAAGDFAAGV
jgi:hypothetical protein